MQIYKLHDGLMNNLESILKTVYGVDVYQYDTDSLTYEAYEWLSKDLYEDLQLLMHEIEQEKTNG